MNYLSFICNCLGLYDGGEYLDKIEKSFGVSAVQKEEDIKELIKAGYTNLGDCIASLIFDTIIERAVDEIGADRSKFDRYLNGSLDTHLYYQYQEVSNWDELKQLILEGGNL